MKRVVLILQLPLLARFSRVTGWTLLRSTQVLQGVLERFFARSGDQHPGETLGRACLYVEDPTAKAGQHPNGHLARLGQVLLEPVDQW